VRWSIGERIECKKADEIVPASATNQKPKASCDESGVEFGARRLAENSTALWSHHSIPRSDETWLPEWSASWAECSGVPFGRAGCLGGRVQFQRDGTSTQAERRPD
jgi:hypothetical protein